MYLQVHEDGTGAARRTEVRGLQSLKGKGKASILSLERKTKESDTEWLIQSPGRKYSPGV